MTFVVVATWTARPGSEAAVEEALRKMIEPSRAEEGCLEYRIQRNLDATNVFLLYEEYRSPEDYERHLESVHFARNAENDAIPLLESRQRAFIRPLAARRS